MSRAYYEHFRIKNNYAEVVAQPEWTCLAEQVGFCQVENPRPRQSAEVRDFHWSGHRAGLLLAHDRKEEKRQQLNPAEEEHVREILRAQGRLFDFNVEDMDQNELREKFTIVERHRRMREEANSISMERSPGLSSNVKTPRLVWEEVQKC